MTRNRKLLVFLGATVSLVGCSRNSRSAAASGDAGKVSATVSAATIDLKILAGNVVVFQEGMTTPDPKIQPPLPGVHVHVVNDSTKRAFDTTTDERGYYSVSNLEFGTYTVTLEKEDFDPDTYTKMLHSELTTTTVWSWLKRKKPVTAATDSSAEQRDKDWVGDWIGQECVLPHDGEPAHPFYLQVLTYLDEERNPRFNTIAVSDGFHVDRPRGNVRHGKFNVLGKPYAATFQYELNGVPVEWVLEVTGHKGEKGYWLGGVSNSAVAELSGDFDFYPNGDGLFLEEYIKQNPDPCAKLNRAWRESQAKR